MDRWVDGRWVDEWTEKGMNGLVDEWVDGWMDGSISGWKDG